MTTPRFDEQFTNSMFRRDPLPEPVSGGSAILDNARNAIAQGWASIGEALTAAKADPNLSPAGQMRKALTAATAHAKTVDTKVASAASQAGVWIRTKETKLPSTTPTDPGTIAAQADIRAVLRGHNAPFAAVVEALEAGDMRPAQAVLSAPNLCCPMDPAQRAELQAMVNRAAAAHDPELAQAQALRKGVEMVNESHARFRELLAVMAKDAQAQGIELDPDFARMVGVDRKVA